MAELNFAAIDIGTNAVRLMIKGIDAEDEGNGKLFKRLLLRIPLRLGNDVFVFGKISEDKKEQLLHSILSFKELMLVYRVARYRVCATSAMRDASNGMSVAQEIETICGIRLEIISGYEEAALLYSSHAGNLFNTRYHYICVDVGGGSTEISRIENGRLVGTESYDIGTLRLLHEKTDPNEINRLFSDLEGLRNRYPAIHIIGSGGNINKLFRLSGTAIGKPLDIGALKNIYSSLKKMSITERMEKLQLKPDRADVIVPAASLFLEIASHAGATQIEVPALGLGDGIINDLFQKYREGI